MGSEEREEHGSITYCSDPEYLASKLQLREVRKHSRETTKQITVKTMCDGINEGPCVSAVRAKNQSFVIWIKIQRSNSYTWVIKEACALIMGAATMNSLAKKE